jgi:hypothetical protein
MLSTVDNPTKGRTVMRPPSIRRLSPVAVLSLVFAALSMAYAVVLLAGATGLGWLSAAPGTSIARLWPEAFTVLTVPVEVHGEAGVATAQAANALVPPLSGAGPAPPLAAEFFGDAATASIWNVPMSTRAWWVAVRALPALGLAVVWWLVFRIAHDHGRAASFSPRTARRLTVIAVVVGVGGPLAALARWLVDRSIVERSTAASIASVEQLVIPLWPVGVGLAVLMAASLVRRGTEMSRDLEGLV